MNADGPNLISRRRVLAHAAALPALSLAASAVSTAEEAEAQSCQASFDGSELVIGNRSIQRRWRVTGGLLYASSFRDLRTGVEWLGHPSRQPAPMPPGELPQENRIVTFHMRRGRFSPVEAPSLVAELTAVGQVTLHYTFQVFPDSAGIRVQLAVEGQAKARGASPVPTHSFVADASENLELAPQHLRLTQVTFADQTDAHNELVFEDEWLLHTAERVRLPGNLFVLENPLDQSGLIFLKEAPLPHARPDKTDADLEWDPAAKRIALLGNGIPSGGTGYRFLVLAYSGGRTGRIEALQKYQRQLRVYDPRRDGMFLSNTWGDRSRDSRINAAFLQQEIEAGARLGVDVIQIDDGWQQGRSKNSAARPGVWQGFWDADPNFWNVDPGRFPRGLGPIVGMARDRHMQFGLWFAPDSSNDFGNWEKDAGRLLELHRTLGIRYFKIDGVSAQTQLAERNLRRFFDRVMQGSGGQVTFDLDVTAQIRPGYFGMMDTGPLFVENRYTDSHRYWPHQTLRNLWKLAQYMDPLRLRIEFLNNSRNQGLYSGDPLAPSQYSPAALFATTMFANPLGWFEVSNLPPEYFKELPPLVAAWKRERARMMGNLILPIGSAPDGASWTGFASVAADRRSGYVLLFRERNGETAWTADAPGFQRSKYATRILGGQGSLVLAGGRFQARIPEELGFIWARLEEPSA